MLPKVNVAGSGPTPDSGVNNSVVPKTYQGITTAMGSLPGYYGTAGTAAGTTNPRFGVAGQATNPFAANEARTPYPLYNQDRPAQQQQTTLTGEAPQLTGSFVNPEQQFMFYLQTGQVNSIPGAIAQQTGMEELLQTPGSGWTFQDGAWRQDPNAAASGGTRTQDVNGNAWDAKTAKTDIYGGQFVQEGARRWVRGADGKVRRQIAYGGKWNTQKGGGGGRKQKAAQSSGFTGNYGVVSFNTATG